MRWGGRHPGRAIRSSRSFLPVCFLAHRLDLPFAVTEVADVVFARWPPLGELRKRAELPLDPAELRGHDRHVDQQEEEEDQVRAGHVPVGALEREQRDHAVASRARRIRLRFAEAAFESSSNQTRVAQSRAIPTRQTRKGNSIESGRPPAEEKVRGWISG